MLGAGAFDCGAGVWLVEMWGAKSAAILQLSKATNGLGVIVAPLLDEPFLVGELKLDNLTQYHHNLTAIHMAHDELNYSIDRRSKLKIPFMIGGGFALPSKYLCKNIIAARLICLILQSTHGSICDVHH